MERNPDVLLETLMTDLEHCRAIPSRMIEVENRDVPLKPSITRDILRLRNERDRMWKEHRKYPSNRIIAEKFKKIRELLP